MAVSLRPTGSVGCMAAAHSRALSKHLSRGAAKALAAAKAVVKTLQEARLMAVLGSMNDEQLNQIGISRSDIPSYAEKLMSDG